MEKYEIVKWVDNLQKRLNDMNEVLQIAQLRKKIDESEQIMASDDFWQDAKKASKFVQFTNDLKENVNDYDTLAKDLEDIQVILELNDESLFQDADTLIKKLDHHLEELEIRFLLDGEYDHLNAIIELHPGAGGTESQDWALMLFRMYKRYAERNHFKFELLDYLEANDAGIKSVTFMISGKNAYGILKGEKGVHRLVRISPFDSNARRHTSFAACNVTPEIDDNIEINMVSDIIALYTMEDDGASLCCHYYCSAAGETERTEVYVVPEEAFIQWLKAENEMPEKGVMLYDNRP